MSKDFVEEVKPTLISQNPPSRWNELTEILGKLDPTKLHFKVQGTYKPVGNGKRYDKLSKKYNGAIQGLYVVD